MSVSKTVNQTLACHYTKLQHCWWPRDGRASLCPETLDSWQLKLEVCVAIKDCRICLLFVFHLGLWFARIHSSLQRSWTGRSAIAFSRKARLQKAEYTAGKAEVSSFPCLMLSCLCGGRQTATRHWAVCPSQAPGPILLPVCHVVAALTYGSRTGFFMSQQVRLSSLRRASRGSTSKDAGAASATGGGCVGAKG